MKIGFAVIIILLVKSGQKFAQGTTAQLSCHVQNCDLIDLTIIFFFQNQYVILQN